MDWISGKVFVFVEKYLRESLCEIEQKHLLGSNFSYSVLKVVNFKTKNELLVLKTFNRDPKTVF